ncbi:MAG: hypothetical protein R3E54_12900 [Halioglobus sp.]
MKKVTLLFIFMLFSTFGWAQAATTNSGYAACLSKQYLDDFISFANAKDTDSIQAYIDSQKCISLKAGLRVTLVDTSGLLSSKVQFAFKGLKLWTVREALNF